MRPIIEVEHLAKRYGATVAVRDVSFDVAAGEIFGVIGANGAGKTTVVECLQGLRHRDGGHVSVLGLDPQTRAGELRRRIGSQLQDSALPDRIRVWEALDLFASFASPRADWRTLMGQWGLAEKSKATFGSLSGGQRQRLFIALALVNHPEVVFLDEMTAGLDPAARREAWELVRAIRERGATVVLVTHFMDEAEALCDRVVILNRGSVVDLDSPQGLIARHASTIRIRFTADGNDLGWLSQVPGVSHVVRHETHVEVEGTGPVLVLTAAGLVEHGIVPVDLRVEQPSLEEVFLSLAVNEATTGATP